LFHHLQDRCPAPRTRQTEQKPSGDGPGLSQPPGFDRDTAVGAGRRQEPPRLKVCASLPATLLLLAAKHNCNSLAKQGSDRKLRFGKQVEGHKATQQEIPATGTTVLQKHTLDFAEKDHMKKISCKKK